MKVLIDFGHLSSRLLYVSILTAKPKKLNGKWITSQFSGIYLHLMFEQLKYIKKSFKNAEIIICLDGYGSWRKDTYTDYKANRIKDPNNDKDEINWEEWYAVVNELVDVLREYFPFKVVGVKKAEADDIIAVLTDEFKVNDEVVIFSEDKDFHQLIATNVKQWKPISKKWVTITPKEVEEFKIQHTVIGDAIDNIPRIVDNTEFTETFKSFLRQNDIFEDDVYKFLQLTISKEMLENFNVYKKIKSGKNKGKDSETKDIYKTIMFGEKALLKFTEDLENNLKLNPLYKINYERNKQLILFENIPSEIRENILSEFSTLEAKYDANGILGFFKKYLLTNQIKEASLFYQGVSVNSSPEQEIDFGW
jgi:5'-3' exonuclease